MKELFELIELMKEIAQQQKETNRTLDLLLSEKLTTQQACKKLGISRSTLSKLRETGQIGYIANGANFQYTNGHILEYIKTVELTPANI